MSFSWQTLDDGYRAQIKLDLPAGAIVYTCNSTMVQLNPLPPLKRGVQNFGDFSSANVIVVGHDEKYILAGAVTARDAINNGTVNPTPTPEPTQTEETEVTEVTEERKVGRPELSDEERTSDVSKAYTGKQPKPSNPEGSLE